MRFAFAASVLSHTTTTTTFAAAAVTKISSVRSHPLPRQVTTEQTIMQSRQHHRRQAHLGKFSLLRKKNLENINHYQQDLSKTTTRKRLTKKRNEYIKECVPIDNVATAAAADDEADIGILVGCSGVDNVINHNEHDYYYCAKSNDSTLGGICVPKSDTRSLQTYWYGNPRDYCDPTAPYYEYCDCDAFDSDLGVGYLICTPSDYYCFTEDNTVCGSSTIGYTLSSPEEGAYYVMEVCYDFVVPYEFSLCYQYDSLSTCAMVIGDDKCQDCQVVDVYNPKYGGSLETGCFEFDCTNTVVSLAGNSCLGDYVIDAWAQQILDQESSSSSVPGEESSTTPSVTTSSRPSPIALSTTSPTLAPTTKLITTSEPTPLPSTAVPTTITTPIPDVPLTPAPETAPSVAPSPMVSESPVTLTMSPSTVISNTPIPVEENTATQAPISTDPVATLAPSESTTGGTPSPLPEDSSITIVESGARTFVGDVRLGFVSLAFCVSFSLIF